MLRIPMIANGSKEQRKYMYVDAYASSLVVPLKLELCDGQDRD